MMPGTARPPSFVQRLPLATYFGVTFAISWAIWLVLILGSLHIQTQHGAALNVVAIAGPSIAALVLAALSGRGDLRRLLAGFSLSRLSGRWTVVALVLPLATMVAAIAVSVAAFGAPHPGVTFGLAGVVLAEFVGVLFLGGSYRHPTGPPWTARPLARRPGCSWP